GKTWCAPIGTRTEIDYEPHQVAPLWQPPNNRSLEDWLVNNGQTQEEWQKVQDMMGQIQHLDCLSRDGCLDDGPMSISNTEPTISDLMDDDIILNMEQAMFLLEQMQSRQKRKVHNFDRFPTKKWSSNKPIKYKFNGQHSVYQMTKIRGALSHWQEQTCLSFEEVHRNQIVPGSHIIFVKRTGCSSYYGQQVRVTPQPISLGANCI
ncbi:unnamed protein product, partial [Owenia fusiformis]